MRFFSFIILLGFALSLSSCSSDTDKYQLASAPDGRVYRLNKSSGALSLVQGTQITPLGETGSKETAEERQNRLAEAKTWKKQSVRGYKDGEAELKTGWRNGSLYFILEIRPWTREMYELRRQAGDSRAFRLTLRDKNEFQILQLTLPLGKAKIGSDGKGNADSFQFNTSVPLSDELYEAVDRWSLSFI